MPVTLRQTVYALAICVALMAFGLSIVHVAGMTGFIRRLVLRTASAAADFLSGDSRRIHPSMRLRRPIRWVLALDRFCSRMRIVIPRSGAPAALLRGRHQGSSRCPAAALDRTDLFRCMVCMDLFHQAAPPMSNGGACGP